jgi:hypothetical protein
MGHKEVVASKEFLGTYKIAGIKRRKNWERIKQKRILERFQTRFKQPCQHNILYQNHCSRFANIVDVVLT